MATEMSPPPSHQSLVNPEQLLDFHLGPLSAGDGLEGATIPNGTSEERLRQHQLS